MNIANLRKQINSEIKKPEQTNYLESELQPIPKNYGIKNNAYYERYYNNPNLIPDELKFLEINLEKSTKELNELNGKLQILTDKYKEIHEKNSLITDSKLLINTKQLDKQYKELNESTIKVELIINNIKTKHENLLTIFYKNSKLNELKEIVTKINEIISLKNTALEYIDFLDDYLQKSKKIYLKKKQSNYLSYEFSFNANDLKRIIDTFINTSVYNAKINLLEYSSEFDTSSIKILELEKPEQTNNLESEL